MNAILLSDGSLEWLLRSSAVLAAVWLLSFIPRVPAALRHAWIVTGMIAALLMPVFMTSLPSWSPGPLTRYVPAPSAPQPGSVIEFPAAESAAFAHVSSIPAPEVSAPARPAPTAPPSSKPLTIPILWLAGTGLLVLRLLIAAVSWRRAVRTAEPLPGSWPVNVRLTSRASAPVSGGLCRSVVLLPSDSVHWPPARMNAVLVHEEEHLRRRDAWWLLLGHLLCAIQWFNPLTWLLHRRAAILREEACDDAALRRGVPPAAYADALLALASPAGLSAIASPMARRLGLDRRIRTVLSPSMLRASVSRSTTLFSLAGLCAFALGASILRSQEKSTPAPQPTPVLESADDASLLRSPNGTSFGVFNGVRYGTRNPLFGPWSPGNDDAKNPAKGEVILNPGGCLTPSSNVMEAVAAAESLNFCVRVKNLIESEHLKVFLTRSDDTLCPQAERIRTIKEHPNAIVLSIQPGDYDSRDCHGVAALVVRHGPGLSRSVVLAHHLLSKFAIPDDARLPPIYYSNDPLLTASSPDTAALILHTGSAFRDETTWRSLVFATVDQCRDDLRKAASRAGIPSEIFVSEGGSFGHDVMKSNGGTGIAALEFIGESCVARWTADHLEYSIPGSKIESMKLTGAAAMQILGKESSEISSADHLSCSMQNQTLHFDGQFRFQTGGYLFRGASPDSSADLSKNLRTSLKACSMGPIRP